MSIDLSGLSSPYSDMLASQMKDTTTQKLQNTVSADYNNATEKELMNACKEFEAYFLEQMFKEMEKTIPDNDNEDATTQRLVDYFKDTAVQELTAQATEQNGLGIAQTLYEQMKRQYSAIDPATL